jgi:hypothetical protein
MSDLLEQHLRLIQGGGVAVAVNDTAEAEVVRGLTLPPLVLPARLARRKPWLWGAGALALAAATAFFVLKPAPPAPVTFKGGLGKTWVVWQRDGRNLQWSHSAHGLEGDQYTAEVLADFDSTAFLAIYDQGGQLLSPARDVVAGHLELLAGERATFSQKFELTGENDGEVLVVVVCHNASLKAAYPDLESFWLAVRPLGQLNETMRRGCQVDQFPLR